MALHNRDLIHMQNAPNNQMQNQTVMNAGHAAGSRASKLVQPADHQPQFRIKKQDYSLRYRRMMQVSGQAEALQRQLDSRKKSLQGNQGVTVKILTDRRGKVQNNALNKNA